MLSKDTLALLGIIDSIVKITLYTKDIFTVEDLRRNELVFDACLINLVNIGEMVSRLSDEFTEAHSAIEWHKIKALRNIIAHDYFGIDYDEIWAVINIHLPSLKQFVDNLLP
jgi:uncharacterized protein with HEPN domain